MHESDEFIVVDKPPGLLTVTPPGQKQPSVFEFLKEYARTRGGRAKPSRTRRVWIIHRLDKEASGLLVFAKSERAFESLKDEFRARKVHRLYVAVIEGEVRSEDGRPVSGTIQSFLAEGEDGLMRSLGVGESVRGMPRPRRSGAPGTGGPDRSREDEPKLAVTHYRVMGTGNGRSLVQVRLGTGRKNQIRVHMSEWKHPLIGDERFGATSNPIGRLALHASELGFTDPSTNQTVRFNSPPPASFYRAVGMSPPPESERRSGEDQAPAPAMAAPSSPRSATDTSWDHVAGWYDELIAEQRTDHYERVILPGTLRLLAPKPGQRVLDIACGQGVLCRRLADLGVQTLGIDSSPRLVEVARRHEPEGAPPERPAPRYEVADARTLPALAGSLGSQPFDAATCVMALMNIEPLDPIIRGCADLLRPGGAFVAIILHPAFRAPGQTKWGWDEAGRSERGGAKPKGVRQFRRVDGYLSPGQTPITMNPGKAAHGAEPVVTWTFHRPIQTYVQQLSAAGLLVDAMEEWPSLRTSQPGPRAAEENRARREIPMFLAIRAVKVGPPAATEPAAEPPPSEQA